MFNRLLILMCLFALAMHVGAAPIDFYGASVPVVSQTSRERSRAAQKGLEQVLIRVSGSIKVAESPNIISALSKASTYLEQYHYQLRRLENGDREEHLVMAFSPSHVQRILSSESIWPTNRPKTLVWLVQDNVETGKSFINKIETPVTQGLQQASVTRGLPISFPLMDLDDQLALSEEQVWALDEEAILEASERYQVDTILVGRYTETALGKWRGTWQFFHRGQNRVFDMRSDTGEELGIQAIAPVADYLARLYSITTNLESDSQLFVQISQVEGFQSYKGVLNYLKRLAVVSSFNMVSIEGENVLLGLQLAGSLSQLESAVSLDEKIQPFPSQPSTDYSWLSTPEGTIEQPLKFVWVGD